MSLKAIDLRPSEDGSFDELVSDRCSVHFEMMDDHCLWVAVRKGKTEYHLTISARTKLLITVSDES